jgi:hypothetical protein
VRGSIRDRSRVNIQLTTDVSLVDLERAIGRYVHELGIELPKVVKQTFRLIMRDIASITSPKNHAQGRKAVARDINRAVYLLDPAKVTGKRLRQAILDKDYSTIQGIFKNSKKGRWNKMRVEKFSAGLHRNVRDKRGRVQHQKNVATPDVSDWRGYVKKVQKHVGFLRSGWVPGLRTAGLAIPTWVSRHSPIEGSASDSTNNPDLKPVMTAKHANRNDSLPRSLINRTIEKRAATMGRDVDQILRGRASRYFS